MMTPARAPAQRLVSWGSDSAGQVSDTPAGTFFAVAAGAYHSVAIRTDGTLVSWGWDDEGQVSNTPAGTYTAVSAGYRHSVAIRTDGTLISWGSDLGGEVSDTPAGTYFAAAAGGFNSVAIRTDGTLVSWGLISGTPAGTYSAVASGDSYAVAIRTDGTLAAWGFRVPPPPAGNYIAVAASFGHGVAMRPDGTLVSWGDDSYGVVTNTPAGVFTAVAAGGYSSAAIRLDGTLVVWGQIGPSLVGAYAAVELGDLHGVAIAEPPAGQIASLSLRVEGLMEGGVSLPADGQSLLNKLDDAESDLEANDVNAAVGNLWAFINQMDAFIHNGKLTPERGQSLIAAVYFTISLLGD